MNNDELEKYLRSFLLCQEYNFFEVFRFNFKRFNGDVQTCFAEKIEINKPIRYYQKMYIPDGYSWNFMSTVKKYVGWNPAGTITYYRGRTKYTYSNEDATNCFVKELKKILDEYLEKNNLRFIDLSLIFTDGPGYGYGSLLIPADTESFLITSYNTGGAHRSFFPKGEPHHWCHPW